MVFHDVQPRTTASGGGAERFDVPLASFETFLDACAVEDYAVCSLADALARPAQRRVAVTFDDGTRGQFDHAVPALRARGMTATFYVTTDWVGTPGFMTWDELRSLVGWGMSVQSHTRTHPFLSELDEARLRAELVDSRTTLDRELGQNTSEIAFPGGDAPSRHLRSLLKDCGYRVVVGTRWGMNRDGEWLRPGFRPIRRCTARGPISADWTRRVIAGDVMMGLRNFGRETGLRRLRSTLGASRYARWRRFVLNSVSSSS
jgi:peptidoglycan/xylan/chitin deacetylase (PgdA/CDA1 family)